MILIIYVRFNEANRFNTSAFNLTQNITFRDIAENKNYSFIYCRYHHNQ